MQQEQSIFSSNSLVDMPSIERQLSVDPLPEHIRHRVSPGLAVNRNGIPRCEGQRLTVVLSEVSSLFNQ